MAIPTPTTFIAATCTSSQLSDLSGSTTYFVSSTTVHNPIPVSSVLSSTLVQETYITMYAPLVQLINQESDLVGSSSMFVVGSSNRNSTKTTNPANPNTVASTAHRVAGRTIAGVVIGALVGMVLLIILTLVLLRRRRQRQSKKGNDLAEKRRWKKAELPDASQPWHKRELGGGKRKELDAQSTTLQVNRLQELEVPSAMHELPEDCIKAEL